MRVLRTMSWMARKELLRFLADRTGAAMTFVVPVVLAVFMSSVFAPSEMIDALPMLVVVEGEGGPNTEALVRRLEDDPAMTVERISFEAARTRVFEGDASAAIILSDGFERALQPSSLFGADQALIKVLLDPSRATEVDILEGLVTREVMEQLTESMQAMPQAAMGAPGMANVPMPKASSEPPLVFERLGLEVFNPHAAWNAYAHYFAGMLTMSLLFLGGTASLNLLREREEGALERVRLTGASPVAALLGFALGNGVIAIAAAFAVFTVGVMVFSLPVSSPVGLVAVLVALGGMVGGFSLLLAALGNSSRQVAILGPFIILVIGFLGGSAVPSFVMPEAVRSVAMMLPSTWANEGLAAATWRGAGTVVCLEWAAGIAAFGVAFALAGAVSFRWRP